MLRLFKSFFVNINMLQNFVAFPVLVTLISVCIFICFIIIKPEKYANKKTASDVICINTALFYFTLLFYITVLGRIGLCYEPFSKIFSDWLIFKTTSEMYYNFSPITNLLLFIPLPFILNLLYKHFKEKYYNKKQLIIHSTLLAFFLSVSIEATQAITRLGTVQLSDLVYNTLSGLLGALLYIAIKRIITKIKQRTQS